MATATPHAAFQMAFASRYELPPVSCRPEAAPAPPVAVPLIARHAQGQYFATYLLYFARRRIRPPQALFLTSHRVGSTLALPAFFYLYMLDIIYAAMRCRAFWNVTRASSMLLTQAGSPHVCRGVAGGLLERGHTTPSGELMTRLFSMHARFA